MWALCFPSAPNNALHVRERQRLAPIAFASAPPGHALPAVCRPLMMFDMDYYLLNLPLSGKYISDFLKCVVLLERRVQPRLSSFEREGFMLYLVEAHPSIEGKIVERPAAPYLLGFEQYR
jgi:hypothetical protein